MLKVAFLFLVVALVLAVLGFDDLAGVAVSIVKLLAWVAAVIAALFFILGFAIHRRAT